MQVPSSMHRQLQTSGGSGGAGLSSFNSNGILHTSLGTYACANLGLHKAPSAANAIFILLGANVSFISDGAATKCRRSLQ